MSIAIAIAIALAAPDAKADLAYLHQVAHEVVDAARVAPGASISNGGKNTTGFALRVPGGTQSFYPAFWIRDAAMMLGGDLVPADEIDGWVKVVAATQPGPAGLTFAHGLIIPGYSAPDHITLQGEACWFPGAYTNQGDGAYGFLPPADDAFFFLQIVHAQWVLSRNAEWFDGPVSTGWGQHPLSEVCDRAFESVATDQATGLVICDATPGHSRVDWGFCDSIRKTGLCLMPSLLRWQAARRLAELHAARKRPGEAKRYRQIADRIAKNLTRIFFSPMSASEGRLMSATGIGNQDDIWASAFAVWLGVLPRRTEMQVARHLQNLCRDGSSVQAGQVRQLPKSGPLEGNWQQATSGRDNYQNGGYWATPTGWLVVALGKVDRLASDRLLHDYAQFVRENRSAGAPFEWVNANINARSNANYGSSAGLVYVAIASPSK